MRRRCALERRAMKPWVIWDAGEFQGTIGSISRAKIPYRGLRIGRTAFIQGSSEIAHVHLGERRTMSILKA